MGNFKHAQKIQETVHSRPSMSVGAEPTDMVGGHGGLTVLILYKGLEHPLILVSVGVL